MGALHSAMFEVTRAVRCIVLAVAGCACAAVAQELPPGLTDGGSGVVETIVDGDTVLLDDGREVRLVGIQAPKLPLGRQGFEAWPLADTARDRLAALVLGRTVRLGYGGLQVDRHRRQLAHLFREPDGLWVQGAMLTEGLARTYTFADNRMLIPALLTAEGDARRGRRGIWTHPYYAILDQADAGDAVDSFALVEGKVVDTAVVRGRAFLNFGADYREDFTITVPPDSLGLFEESGINIGDYYNKRVRVRGWVQWRNGPSITATHPEQIELLDP